MEINLLKINGFGKIKNKEIKLNKNINIIYGKNEDGKTTTLKFLNAMLYGASKNKNGKDISDLEKYKPWDGTEYSGKITYKLDNGEEFEVFREFDKKNPKIFNSKLEDISKTFKIDKTKGNLFFEEQTGVDEELFNSSTLVGQKEIILDNADRRNITQKISNLFTTGAENISYKKIIDKLNKKYTEEIGTERTTDRPINKINNQINEINNKIKNIEIKEENKKNIINKKNNINNEIKNIENKKLLLNEIKKIKEKIKNINEEIKIKNNLIEENNNKINLLKNNIEENKKNNKLINKIINKKIIILFSIILILEIINLIIKIIDPKIKIIISIFLFLIFLIIFILNIINNNKKNKIEKNNLDNEINILEKLINELNEDINNINNVINKEEENEKNNIINKYNNYFNNYEIAQNFNTNLENLEEDLKKIEEKNNDLKFEKYQIDIEEKNINNNIEAKINLEENLENLLEQEKEIIKNGESIKLAKEIIEKSYNKMKNNITPKFKNNLLKNETGIIGKKYKNIIFNEEEGIKVELENGNFVNANLLSIGTIDQMYLALRLAILQEISKEPLPIVLDETFAYYDDDRLKNILNYLNDNFEKNQIIIFTCSKREKEILDNLKIDYNYVEL